MVEKIVKAMDSMSMKSFLQSICCKIRAMVRGNVAVYNSMREVKRMSMSSDRYFEKKNPQKTIGRKKTNPFQE